MRRTAPANSIVITLCAISAPYVLGENSETIHAFEAISTRTLNSTNMDSNAPRVSAVRNTDSDSDGITNDLDNCTLTENNDQRDTDADGYGNLCDADFNNDLAVNVVDLGIFRSRFFTGDPDADLNGDGIVNATDLGLFRTRYFQPVGPSAVGNIGPLPPELDAFGNPDFFNELPSFFISLDGNFTVTWSSTPGAVSYDVTREKIDPQPDTFNTTVVGSNLLDQTNLPRGVYLYTVRACSQTGVCGKLSEPIRIEVEYLNLQQENDQ
ncbi:MAG: GC-type dockerin domain-anchored protein [Gammaproteobacteria bacterium]